MTYRKANGRRVDGAGLAIRIAQEVKGKLLAHAFVLVRGAGYQLRVNKLDGLQQVQPAMKDGIDVICVDVINGLVNKSWADQRARGTPNPSH
jgi:hypothetical protein